MGRKGPGGTEKTGYRKGLYDKGHNSMSHRLDHFKRGAPKSPKKRRTRMKRE